jgi:hypothetical protein
MKNILTFLLLIFLFACQPNRNEENSKNTVEMPTDFIFRIDFNTSDHFDSKDSTLRRSYNFSDTTLKVSITNEEKIKVYNTMIENNFFDLPSFIQLDTTKYYAMCEGEERIIVFINGKTKILVKFDRGGAPLDSNEYLRFDNVRKLIVNMITKSNKYKKLSQTNVICL